MGFSRRQWLVLTGATVGAGVGVGAWTGLLPGDANSVLADAAAARKLGRSVLQTADPGLEAFAQKLSQLPLGARRRDWLRRQMRDDYVGGRLVLLERWWLSRTEARLCACFAEGMHP